MKASKTQRGFTTIDFEDRNALPCSIQKSSLATEDAIWFGVDDPKPVIMGSAGWEPYPIPREVLLHTRMHLTQEQVIELLPTLIEFASTGRLPDNA